jgi:alpha-amylase
MYLMVDVVVNHVGASSGSPDFASYKPFQSSSQYHPQCWISDYTNQTEVEQCWLGDSKAALVDINTEDDQVVKALNDWVGSLVKNYEVDGIRIDTVKHVRKDFWPQFAQSAGVWTIGEVLSDDVKYTADYTQVLDAVLDYPTWFQLTSGFSKTDGDLSKLASVVATAQSAYKNGEASTGSFLENHDQPRFGSLTGDQALIKNAVTWPFINDGVPILYYGQEQGYKGGADPANRESLWNVGYSTENPLISLVTTLNKARKAAIAFNSDFLKTPVRFLEQANPSSTLAVYKAPLLTLLTNAGAKGSATWKIDGSAGLGSDTKWIDVLSCTSVTAGQDGSLQVKSSGGDPVVLMSGDAVSKDPTLCPHVEARVDATSGQLGRGVSSMTFGLAVLFGTFVLL